MKKIINYLIFMPLLTLLNLNIQAQESASVPIRLAIAGATHGHIAFILGRKPKPDFKLVGIYEPDRELALRYAKKRQETQLELVKL
jgi:hypothetical protein